MQGRPVPRAPVVTSPSVVRPAHLAAAVLAGALLVYGLCAAVVPIYTKGEAREALVGRAVAEGHGFVLPSVGDERVPAKPPLYHWLAGGALAGGVRPVELALRLPSVVLGAGGLALTAFVVARLQGVWPGALAALLLGASFQWFRAATESRVDMALAFFVALAILAWRRGVGSGARWALHLGNAAAVLGVLVKGPVGAVLPLLVVAADSVAAGEARHLRRLLTWSATAAAVLCIGWYAAAWMLGGEAFAQRQLLHENVYRFLGVGRVEHAHSVAYYLPVLLAGLFPAVLAAPLALRRLGRDDVRALRFALVWIGTVFVFYSAARGKRGVYLLPLYPPVAAVLATGLARALRTAPRRPRAALVALTAGVAGGAAVLLLPRAPASWASAVGAHIGGADADRLPFALAIVYREGITIAAAVLALAGFVAALLAARRPVERLVALGGLAVAWIVGLTFLGTLPLARTLAPRDFAARVRSVVLPDDHVCALGDVPDTLRFYLRRSLPPCRRLCATDTGRSFAVRRAAYVAGASERCLQTRIIDVNPRAGEPLLLDERRFHHVAPAGRPAGDTPE
jgi:4-amino-4-deoxy-L-arabinose transferase-like glycosyltransferase